MVDSRTQSKHEPARDGAPALVGEAAPQATPGLDAVKAVTATGAAGAQAVVRIVRRYPMERDEVMAWLHRHRGNAFVQEVTSRLGELERVLPEGIDLKSVRATVTVPAGKALSGSWQASVATRHATDLTVEVSQTGIRAWVAPALFVDATWPLQNAEVRGAGLQFARGRPYAEVVDCGGLGSGVISIADKISEMLTDAIHQGVAGTPVARPGYVPTHDTDLQGTLDQVVAGFRRVFTDNLAGDGRKAESGKPPVLTGHDLQQVSAGATVALRAGGSFLKDGNGLAIAAGSDLSMTIDSGSSVAELKGGAAREVLGAGGIKAVRVLASGMEVVASGKPIARISALRLDHGGGITIDQMELVGAARQAQVVESGLSLLVSMMAAVGGGGRAGDAMRNAQDPRVVDGVMRTMLERQFTETVHKMILQYRAAVPGMDLARALGLG